MLTLKLVRVLYFLFLFLKFYLLENGQHFFLTKIFSFLNIFVLYTSVGGGWWYSFKFFDPFSRFGLLCVLTVVTSSLDLISGMVGCGWCIY